MPWFKVQVERSEMTQLMKNIKAWDGKKRMAVENSLKAGTRDIQKQAKIRVPVRTGKLKKTVKQRFSAAKMTGEVYSNLPYAHLVEFGFKAHTVRPKKKKAMKVSQMGGDFFTKKAEIPKQNARPFLKPAYEYEEHHIINSIKKALNKDEKIT